MFEEEKKTIEGLVKLVPDENKGEFTTTISNIFDSYMKTESEYNKMQQELDEKNKLAKELEKQRKDLVAYNLELFKKIPSSPQEEQHESRPILESLVKNLVKNNR